MTQPPATASELSDWVNPVAVKELRQAVQSRWVVVVLMLFLLVNLTVVGGFLLLSEARSPAGPAGGLVFGVLLSVLAITCLFFVPAYTGIRLSLERSRADIDLCFLTALTPGAIVRGKYLAAMALTLLIFSACMPFMMLTYLLRGIDLPTIFWVLASCFVICAAANAMGLCAGAVSGGWFVQSLAAVAVLYFLFRAGSGLLGIVTLSSGGASMYSAGLSMWANLGAFLLGRALAIGLMYVLAVALLSPPASNRMLVPRLYIVGVWAITGCLAIAWEGFYGTGRSSMATWSSWNVVAVCALAVAAVGERDTWGPRVRRTIPRRPLLRGLAFLVYTGSAGGLLYCTLLFAATMLVVAAWWALIGSLHGSQNVPELILNSLIGFGFVLCYCLTAVGLRVRFFPNVPAGPYLSLLAVLVGAAATLVPCLAVFFLGGDWWLYQPWALLASPLVIATDREPVWGLALVVLLGWFALSAVGAAPWFLGQWRRFTRCEESALQDESFPGDCPDFRGTEGDSSNRPAAGAAKMGLSPSHTAEETARADDP